MVKKRSDKDEQTQVSPLPSPKASDQLQPTPFAQGPVPNLEEKAFDRAQLIIIGEPCKSIGKPFLTLLVRRARNLYKEGKDSYCKISAEIFSETSCKCSP